MRSILLALATATACLAATPPVVVVPATVAIVPTRASEVAITQVLVGGTNPPITLTVSSGAADYFGVVTSLAGAVITEPQRNRFLSLLVSYQDVPHIVPINETNPTTAVLTYHISPAGLEAWQIMERLDAKRVALAMIAPVIPTPVVTNSPPVIVIPNP